MLRCFHNGTLTAYADHELIESYKETSLKGMAPSSIRSRRSDLAKAGYLNSEAYPTAKTPSGRDAYRFYISPKGREFMWRADGQV